MKPWILSLPSKILLTTFTILLIYFYVPIYGVQNFLWLSDISLFLSVAALWLESPLIISIAVVGLLPAEILWNIDLLLQLITGKTFFYMTNYMFDEHLPLYIRLLSLFHVALPPLWIWLTWLWGYRKVAVWYAFALIYGVFIASFLLTTPACNINAVFTSTMYNWHHFSPVGWLLTLMTLYAVVFIVPMHILLITILYPSTAVEKIQTRTQQ